jgi:hypothetical protein
LLDKSVIGTTQYIWQPQLSFNEIVQDSLPADSSKGVIAERVKTFIWTVQTFTQSGFGAPLTPVTEGNINGDGRTEPAIFYIIRKKGTL